MPAPFKKSNSKKISEIAKEVISAVKKTLSAMDENVNEVKVEVCLLGHGARPFGSYLPNDYRDITIKVGKDHWEGLDDFDVSRLKYELDKYVKDFDNVSTEGIYLSFGNFTPDVDNFPTTFMKFGKPCKEFKELSKLVSKKFGITLKVDDLYTVRLFGKSGRYGESGKRNYVAYSGNTCTKLIAEIKSFGRKKTTAKMVITDDIDTDYSERYLTECYGSRKRELKIMAA